MYLFVDLAYALGLIIANRLEVPGNFTETARRIVASETLYRIALSSQLNREYLHCVSGFRSLCSR